MGIITKPEFYFINDELDFINNEIDSLELGDIQTYNKYIDYLDKNSKRREESKKARIKQSGLRIVK